MTPTHIRPGPRPNRHYAVATLLALRVGGALLSGCGSSSKPAYCDPISKTEKAVKSLPTAQDVRTNGPGTLRSALSIVQQDATTAVDQAKSDFSSQASALKTAVDALSSTGTQLAGSSRVQTLALLPELSTVAHSAASLQNAVLSKCG